MLKSVLAAASVAVVLANVGCSAAPDSESSASDQALASTSDAKAKPATLSLADAQTQVDAVRAKLAPTNDYDLIFNTALAKPYLDAIEPIFAQVAPTDVIPLAMTALTAVSADILNGAIFDRKFFDNAVGTFADLSDFSFYWGSAQSNPAFWTKLNLIISHSSAAPLSDLQLLSIVTTAAPQNVLAGLEAVHWETARTANEADANSLDDNENLYGTLDTALFGPMGYTITTGAHDLDFSDAFAVSVFTRSYGELKLLTKDDAYEDNIVDLAEHLNQVEEESGHRATKTIALAKSLFTAAQVKILNIQLTSK